MIIVLAIGTEELPPQDVVDASKKTVVIAFIIQEVRGPPVSKAFDQEGNPTKAAEGFSSKYSVPLDLVYRKVDGKTKYVIRLYKRVFKTCIGGFYSLFLKSSHFKLVFMFLVVLFGKHKYHILVWYLFLKGNFFYSCQDLPATIAKISFPKTMRWNSKLPATR
ncbi:glycine--tRNA ligase, chloroplastic/mitochondrial 2-like [Trifolium pratense]|uniref:glycine--tRNA ligase, chloroplastic/mitochondrial 2-like n=1 Tax=Trifolium pratense TaxID=57577 RepID=UPI001E69011A|nr:glycine--tRNA ligase, chloroplastic/mitochondrial 2-like [Trifolium pratense]XP_045827609.1 glycine--tRNA ligase, chloroplastic/mitochondrial 2-like [Trifolium pratense]